MTTDVTNPTPKKSVLHQELYGSSRRRTPQQQQQHLPHHPNRHIYSTLRYDGTLSTEAPSCRSHYNLQHLSTAQQQQQQPYMGRSASYTTLPPSVICCNQHTRHTECSRLCIDTTECDVHKHVMAQCTCDTASYLQHSAPHRPYPQFPMMYCSAVGGKPKARGNGCYFGYENVSHITDEEDSAFPGLPERELNLLHRNVPALRRTGVDTTGFRQYFYPDGGWGWIICGIAFLAHLLTTGLQLSYGIFMIFVIQHVRHASVSTEWLGALSWSVSTLIAPFVVALCRKKSSRLIGVMGGLLLPLGILFTSFATELEQIVFSYGFLFGIGVSMVRDSSTIMLGNYFRRRRNFVEMVAMAGEGVGIALFSMLLKEGIGKTGWSLGLQIIACFLTVSFFMAMLYRPASLYHPQRRAIQHLKNQRKKLREGKSQQVMAEKKSSFLLLDISSLKSANVRILLMTSGVAALGIYAPMFTISLNVEKDDSEIQNLVLLQSFLGIATTVGVILASIAVKHPFRIRKFHITTQVISQIFISTIAIAILFLSFVMSYQGLCILSAIYGIGFGGFRYSLKILALERLKLKHFPKAWGFIRGVESIPVLVSVPLTTFLNDYSLKYGRAGYYICSAAAAIAGIIIFFINHTNMPRGEENSQTIPYDTGIFSTLLPPPPTTAAKFNARHNAMYGFNNLDCDYGAFDLMNRSCLSLNNIAEPNTVYRHIGSPVCCRLQVQCLRGDHTPQPFDRYTQRRRTIDSEIRRPMPLAMQYVSGHGSVGSRLGKRLQKNLSHMQSSFYCPHTMRCTCLNRSNYTCAHHHHQGFQFNPASNCTCTPAHHCRSLSVPESLSALSQQCVCNTPLPLKATLPYPMNHSTNVFSEYQLEKSVGRTPSKQRNFHIQKPSDHFIEQMTTSV